MLIGLDYDDTFTADVDFWCQVVALGRLRGHRFVCVTARREPPDAEREPHIPMPVVCAGSDWKDVAAKRAGHVVDVWIDDLPELIRPEGLLRFDDSPSAIQLQTLSRMLGLTPELHNVEALRRAWAFVKGQT